MRLLEEYICGEEIGKKVRGLDTRQEWSGVGSYHLIQARFPQAISGLSCQNYNNRAPPPKQTNKMRGAEQG